MKQIIITLCLLTCLLTALFAKIDFDFSDNTVIVVLTPEASNPTQILPPSFFGDVEIKQLKNISLIYNEKAIQAIQARGSQYQAIYKLTLTTNDTTQVLKAIEQLNKIPDVAYATPNYLIPSAQVPNDEFYSTLWGMHGEHGIKAPQAWDISTGSHNVRVGVIDTGIVNHPDLDANVTTGYDFYNENEITNDDVNGHGTHVAGIIGAVGDNEIGVVGVNWDVTIVPLQACSASYPEIAFFTIGELVAAITYATNTWGTEEQISVLNHSISGYGGYSFDARLTAIDSYPGLFVWSAGNADGIFANTGFNVDSSDIESFNLSNIIAVGALQADGQKSGFSNYSSSGNYVHIYAPGSGIGSTVLNNDYDFYNGTSMAAPHVVGVAALLLSVDPSLTAPQLKQLITASADQIIISTPLGPQVANRLNAFRALQIVSELPFLDITPEAHYFGAVNTHETSQSQTISISTQGSSTFTVDTITITGEDAENFNLSVAGLPWILTSNDIGTFTVSFSPTTSGVKNANLIIISDAVDSPHIISLSGTGWVATTNIPYAQDFNNVTSLNDISWGGAVNSYLGFFPNSGVSGTEGLTFFVNYLYPTQNAYTQTLTGVTEKTFLSFAYRIVITGNFQEVIPVTLNNANKVYVEVSTSGASGPYNILSQITSTNHIPTTVFQTMIIPLSAYDTEDINIRFRAVCGSESQGYFYIMDDVYISNYPPPASITADITLNSVSLSWTPPLDTEDLLSYTVYRDDTHLADLPASTFSFSDHNVALGSYSYSVKAVFTHGISSPRATLVDVPILRPFSENFDQYSPHAYFIWGNYVAWGVVPGYGVNNSNGLALEFVELNGGYVSVYTPRITDITEQTALSFAYRIIYDTSYYTGDYTAAPLTYADRVYIEVSLTGGTGTYYGLHTIDRSNHITSAEFATLVLPLSAYAGQNINIRFRLTIRSMGDLTFVLDDVVIDEGLSQTDEVVVPVGTALVGNYPNPFNPETVISFSTARKDRVVIDVFNIKGQRVRSLVSGVYEAGEHSVVWNGLSDVGRQVGSGVYFYRMVAGEYRAVRKMVLVK